MRAPRTITSHVLANAVAGIAAIALSVGTLGGPALAAPPDREHIDSTAAAAFSSTCVGSACTVTSVFVTTNDGVGQACLDILTFDSSNPSAPTIETGCASVAESSFTLDTRNLSAAALTPTAITLQTLVCDPSGCAPTGATRNVVVGASFTGIGDIATFRANSKSSFGSCTMYFVGKGSSREALANFTIDGALTASLGFISTSTQKVKVICH